MCNVDNVDMQAILTSTTFKFLSSHVEQLGSASGASSPSDLIMIYAVRVDLQTSVRAVPSLFPFSDRFP